MFDMKILLWLFPILFIFHDLEEIIFIEWWITGNQSELAKRFPVISKKLLPHFENIKTASFAIGVAEEFLIILIITTISYATGLYGPWIGIFMVFFVHLFIHILQAAVLGKYIPALITSLVCLPPCFYIFA